ncbi:hypothetical protein Y1Q_0000833 [Alligator mississippiensis]|uniref:SCAN box domain-containing protein n=1 Tax=Alligator mississippiensis TaxID=8496 RepID=A0A151MVZ6_ALLMI|nr:hypothetical protein Y1Q_0000833 [Alligator mississippiensis]
MAAELEPVAAVDLPWAALVQTEVKMEKQDAGGLKAGAEGVGRVSRVIQAGAGGASLRRSAPQHVTQQLKDEPVQQHEIQGQEVKQAMQTSFEAKLPLVTPQPALRDDLPNLETWRQRFRGLCYQAAEGPREVCSRLRELCRGWLEPQRRSKEQMLELVVLEQFLAVLPREMQSWEWERGVQTCAEAVTLAEGFQLGQAEDKEIQGTVNVKVEAVSSVKTQPTGALQQPVDGCLEQPKAHPADMLLEEAGQRKIPGPQDKPLCIPKEEPLPDEELDFPKTKETWELSGNESSSSRCPRRGLSPEAARNICNSASNARRAWECLPTHHTQVSAFRLPGLSLAALVTCNPSANCLPSSWIG